MRAIDNVAFGLNQLSSAQRRETAQSWLDKVGLGSRARAFPHELSGGEQQRVALARALAIRPGLVLLDEPFSGLDPSLRAELRDVALSAIRDVGASAVFVTHDIEEALYVGDDLAILKAGRVLQSGKTGDVYDTPICVEAAAALGPINTWRGPCAAGIMQTPFGAIATRVEDGPATLVIRAEALRVREGHGATLIARQRIGALDLLRFDYAGATWKALAPREDNLSPGAQCGLALDPRGVFTYAADLVSG
jgi:iron(III) transport system ATP-binding protein